MLNRIAAFIGENRLIAPGDRVICAVSGGADSMALLWAMYLLRDKLNITVEAAHFNHGLRGAESDGDEAFVRGFCRDYGIGLTCGRGQVTAGKKGLEAAARAARYDFFRTLDGKVATAHTANDNAETVLMHMVRGTGLRGLGAIAPRNGKIIRPMLTVTRQQVLAFLQDQGVSYVEDSTNGGDDFLRNRLRHHVMPLLLRENPKLFEDMSAMALELRQDARALETLAPATDSVEALRAMAPALRRRSLHSLLEQMGVFEPERRHVLQAEKLVLSEKPSAKLRFPGGVTVSRQYDRLAVVTAARWAPVKLQVPGVTALKALGLEIQIEKTDGTVNTPSSFTVCPTGILWARPRQEGDKMRFYGGTKSVKKWMIDKKIPAVHRGMYPVLADDNGIVGLYAAGADQNRIAPGYTVTFKEIKTDNQEELWNRIL